MFFSLLKNKIRPSKAIELIHPDPSAARSTLNTSRVSAYRAELVSTSPQFYVQQKRKKRARDDSAGFSHANPAPSVAHKSRKGKSNTPVQERHRLPWNDITHMLGLESTAALSNSIVEIEKICQQNPHMAGQLAPVIEQLEQARRTAMITLQFVRSRTVAEHETGYVSLREIAMEVLNQRSAWLEKRHIRVSVGPLDAKLVANITALFLLIDELVSWAGKLAPEIVIAINPSTLHRSGIQLLVYAKFAKGHALDAEWKNVGWYLWHKLATAVGGSAELNVMDEALCVSVTFVPTTAKQATPTAAQKPAPKSAAQPGNRQLANDIKPPNKVAAKSASHLFSATANGQQTSVRELSHDKDIAAIVQGCHVKLIMSDDAIKDQVIHAMTSLGLRVTWSKNVQAALLDTKDSQIPHAVIFHSQVNIGEILQLRCKWAEIRATAYIELMDAEETGPQVNDSADFHFSSVGTMSTAHVTTHAIADSLAPALLFELCKVL